MNTTPSIRAVRVLFYCALVVALGSGLATVWLISADAGEVSVVTLVAMLCALTSALMLDYSEDERPS